MQTAFAPELVSRPAESRPAAAQLAEIRFESDAALERALALAAGQTWIAACAVDRARRTLRLTLAAGASQRPVSRHASAATLH